jgi:hypothetical protein
MAKSKTREARKSAKASKRTRPKAAQARSARTAKNARKATKSKSSPAGRRRAATTRPAAKKASGAKRGGAAKRRSAAQRNTAAKRSTSDKRSTAATRSTAAKRAISAKAGASATSAARTPAPPTRSAGESSRRKETPGTQRTTSTATGRRSPNLDRERRTVSESEGFASLPSSLNLDRSASAARSGRAELAQKLHEHTSTGPAMTAGDIDADWESAETVGDEAPGGDNPTPDQDVVEEIGKALGVEYADDQELQGGDEIVERDRKRWELDPASSDDFDDRE